MTKLIHGQELQVVEVREDHSYVLNEELLQDLLLKDEVKNLPVAVVSVVGPYRGGKSFLLNLFLRYLKAPVLAQENGSWIGDDGEPLVGFSWRSGSRRNTTGILLWSEPIIVTQSSGQKVAVLLMDTQGTFDATSTVRDNSIVFALSSLLSSIEIYNISQNIQEDDLQTLQLFTEYGKLAKDQGSKPFQTLEFLVRDWPNPFEYPYGHDGGKAYLDGKLEVTPDLPEELKNIRQNILDSFENVDCFLLPHPGLNVQSRDFVGAMKEKTLNGQLAVGSYATLLGFCPPSSKIELEFRQEVMNLVKELFSPEKLMPKKINGEQVTSQEIFNYFKAYMNLFNSGTLPTPSSIFEATAEASRLSAMNEARQVYQEGMEEECGSSQPSVPAPDVALLHAKYKELARQHFITKKIISSNANIQASLDRLLKELDDRLMQYLLINKSKIQTAVSKAQEEYEEVIRTFCNGKPLCVHPEDLQRIHIQAVQAAIKIFDDNRKSISNRKDDERLKFVQNIENQYALLRLLNEQNNNLAVVEERMNYWLSMEVACSTESPLSDAELAREHERLKLESIKKFKARRNLPNTYADDIYLTKLIETIDDNFSMIRTLNQTKFKAAINAAINMYSSHMNSLGNMNTICLHPMEFDREHSTAKCNALHAFRPSRDCDAGFNADVEDERILQQVINNRYFELKLVNDNANNIAVQKALDQFVANMTESLRFTYWWILIIPMIVAKAKKPQYYEEYKQKAIELFYSYRRSGNRLEYQNDIYRDALIHEINKAYETM